MFTIHETPNATSPAQLLPKTFASARDLLATLYDLAVTPVSRANKDGAAFIPVAFAPPRPDGQYEGKGHRPTPEPYRANVNVGHVAALALDIDRPSAQDFDRWVESLRQRNIQFVAWPTHSHGLKPGARYRVVFGLSKPIRIGSPWRWSQHILPKLLKHVGAEALVDTQTTDPARLFYLPSRPPNAPAAPAPLVNLDGHAIDVDRVLAWELNLPYDAYVPWDPEPALRNADAAVDKVEFLARLRGHFKKQNLRELFDRAERGVPLAVAGDRHLALRDLTMCMGQVARPDEDTEALVAAVLAPSLKAMATSPADYHDLEAYAVRSLLPARSPSFWARCEAAKDNELEAMSAALAMRKAAAPRVR